MHIWRLKSALGWCQKYSIVLLIIYAQKHFTWPASVWSFWNLTNVCRAGIIWRFGHYSANQTKMKNEHSISFDPKHIDKLNQWNCLPIILVKMVGNSRQKTRLTTFSCFFVANENFIQLHRQVTNINVQDCTLRELRTALTGQLKASWFQTLNRFYYRHL